MEHPELVPAFLNSFKLTLFETDISLRRTRCAGPNPIGVPVLEGVGFIS